MCDTICDMFITLNYWKGELAFLWEILSSPTFWMAVATVIIAGATVWNAKLFNRHNKLNIELQCAHEAMEAFTPLNEFIRTSDEKFAIAIKDSDPLEWKRVKAEVGDERERVLAQIDTGRRMRNRILKKYGCEDMIGEVSKE